MTRGDIVTVALQGDFEKPRPALVIQADQFAAAATVSVVLISGTLVDAPLIRISLEPSVQNGLQKPSQIMIDKVMTIRRDKIGPVIGRLEDDALLTVNRALALFLGFG